MKEFKDYATMVEEKKIKAKKKRDEAKELRLEANFKERQERYKTWEEDRDIIRNVREHYTAEQIANKDYLQNAYESKEDWEQGYGLKNEIEYELTLMKNLLEGFGNRLDMLEGKPPYYLCKEDLMRR